MIKITCSSCGIEKVANLKNFHWRNAEKGKNGYTRKAKWRKQCKECILKNREKYWHANKKIIKEKRKDYFIEYRSRPENKKRAAKRSKLWYFENKHKKEFKEKREIYRVKNLDRDRITRKNWRRKNSERLNLKEKEKCKTDINHKLRKRIRTRIRNAIVFHTESNRKDRGSLELLDAPNIKFVWKHLESQFEPWMNWNNYGKYNKNYKTWQIDHIIPCASFDLKCPVQQLACFHWSNLQPLLSETNLSKGAKLKTPTLKREKNKGR